MTEPQQIDARSATELAILGVLRREHSSGQTILSLVKHIVGRSWQPTSDVIAQTLDALERRGLVHHAEPGRSWDTIIYGITAEGSRALEERLCTPLAGAVSGRFDRAAVALRVCFLDLIPLEDQRQRVGEIIGLYDVAISHAAHALERCACEWPYVAGWMDLEVGHLRDEQAWFKQLQTELRMRETAPVG